MYVHSINYVCILYQLRVDSNQLYCLHHKPYRSHDNLLNPLLLFSFPSTGFPTPCWFTATCQTTWWNYFTYVHSIKTSSGAMAVAHVTIGAGHPPVTSKLVAKIEAGEFVDMAELLLHRWGVTKSLTGNEPSRAPKPRQCTVITILEWVQCFSIYLAVIVKKQPQRIPDLLA